MKTIRDRLLLLIIISVVLVMLYCNAYKTQIHTKVVIVERSHPPEKYPRIDLERTPMNRFLNRLPISTRGFTTFSNIGYLYDNENIVLPLYGKQTYCGSITWNYYILDQEHRIKIPLEVESRDCMEEIGCKELYNDDTVFVKALNKTFKIYIYKPNLYL